MDILEVLAANVRARRAALRMEQAELARRAGVGRSLVGEVEGGKRDVRIRSVQKIAGALGVTSHALLDPTTIAQP